MAYGFIRMFYMKQPDFAAGAYVYVLDALSIVMTIVALAPAALKFAMIGRLVNQLQAFNASSADMLKLVHDFERILGKTLLFIQEVEVIQRGFTLVTVPVARLELGILKSSSRQCSELRHVIFHHARKVMLQVKSATSDLLKQFPSHVELEGLSSYLANIPLDEYGPPINVPDCQGEELRQATDDYCLGSLKAVSHIVTSQISEFLRVLCVLCLVQADEPRRTKASGYTAQLKFLKTVEVELEENLRLLEKSYILHKNLEVKLENLNQKQEDDRGTASETLAYKPVSKAVRSLRLHLQTTLQRGLFSPHSVYSVITDNDESRKDSGATRARLREIRIQTIDDELENAIDSIQNSKLSSADCLQSKLQSDLDYARSQLAACHDCWEEADRHLMKLLGPSASKTRAAAIGENIPLVQDCSAITRQAVSVDSRPVIEDQVFEGYPEYCDLDSDAAYPLLTEEEKRDQREALRVLSELKSVIAIRAQQTVERERNALLRQNPDYQFGADDDSTGNHPSKSELARIGGRRSESVEIDPGIRRRRPEESASNEGDSVAGSCDMRAGLSQAVNVTSDDAPLPDSSCSFSKHVALLAIAKSRQMSSMPMETFEADAESDDSDGSIVDDDRNDSDADDNDVSASD